MKRKMSLAVAVIAMIAMTLTLSVPRAHAQNDGNVGQLLAGLINIAVAVNTGDITLEDLIDVGDITVNDLIDVRNVLNNNEIRILNNVLNNNRIVRDISIALTNLFVDVGLINVDVNDVPVAIVVGVLGGQFVILPL